MTVTGTPTGDLDGLWAARDIAGPDDPRLQMPWMYGDSPDMERRLVQRHWRALAHWKPVSWHLPLAVFTATEPVGMQHLWAEEFARRRSVGLRSPRPRPRPGEPAVRPHACR